VSEGTARAKPLRLAWWEALLAVPLALVALLFFIAGSFGSGLVILAVTAIALLWRAEIVERNIPGGFARARAWVLTGQWISMAAIYIVLNWAFWIGYRDHWTRTRPGVVAVYASAGLAFFLVREMMKRGDAAFDHFVGGDAEIRVGPRLSSSVVADGMSSTM
jgi:hypothetical protein